MIRTGLHVLVCLGTLNLAALSTAQTLDPPVTLPETIWVQFHRGAGQMAPENTLESFQLAWRWSSVPEADVRRTKDGVLVAFHDNDFARVGYQVAAELQKKRIEELTFDQIQQIDVGRTRGEQFAGQRVPAMREVFAALQGHPERRLYLDEKDAPLEQLAPLVAEFHLEPQVVLASTHYERLRLWKRLLPNSRTLHWMGGSEPELAKRIAALREANFADLTQLQIHVRVGDLNSPEPFSPSSSFLRKVAEELHARGILFQSFLLTQGNNRAAYHRLMELGVESFATDYPRETLEAISEHLAKGKQK